MSEFSEMLDELNEDWLNRPEFLRGHGFAEWLALQIFNDRRTLVHFSALVTPSQHEILTAVLRDLPNVVKPECEHDWRPCYEGDVCDKCGKVVTSGEWD